MAKFNDSPRAPARAGGVATEYGSLKFMGLSLSPSPDLRPTRRLIIVAVVFGLLVCAVLASRANLTGHLGDTDDATRLLLVRDLLAGRGWYDQWLGRMGPPLGTYMHWSRLLDGALAGVESVLRVFMAPATAELAMRFFWPLAWVFPAVGAALIVGRNLGGRSAVMLTAILLINPILYRQFMPGRIDHHNIQIAMTVIALACAVARTKRARWAAIGGVATALGLAIGLEALALQAMIGASFGLALARDRDAARPAAAYGLALAGASAAFFLIQTPPWRWSLSFCDALALNLTVALVLAGLGLAATAWIAAKAPGWARLALLGVVGVAAVGAYVALHPACLHGPFAELDPAVRPIWFDHILETQPLDYIFKIDRAGALTAGFMSVLGLAGAVYLMFRERPWLSPGHVLVAGCVIVAVAVGFFAWRMQDYVFWVGTPVLGAALSRLAARRLGDLMVPSVVLAVIASPEGLGLATSTMMGLKDKPGHDILAPARAACFAERSYAELAGLPKGVVLSEQDLGAFILALTPHATIAAPYHRLSASILAAHNAFNAPPALAEARVRALSVTYVVDCPPYPMYADQGSFGARLRAGQTPAWLEPLSTPKATLRIYRVRPLG